MPPELHFSISYSPVERALAAVHGIAAADIPALRSRFGALQRSGLLGPEARIGKGPRLAYGADQLHRVVLAFELVQAGFGPSVILRLIAEHWDNRLRDIFSKAESALVHETSDVILILAGLTIGFGDEPVPNIQATTLDKLPKRLTLGLDGKHLPARMLLINLTGQLRKFHTALAHYHLLPEIVSLVEPSRLAQPTRKRQARSAPETAAVESALPAPRRRAKSAAVTKAVAE